jgi:hypothetical protein
MRNIFSLFVAKSLMIFLLVHIFVYTAIAQKKQKQLFFEDPRSGSFTIFGDIPVSHTTGVPDISIPPVYVGIAWVQNSPEMAQASACAFRFLDHYADRKSTARNIVIVLCILVAPLIGPIILTKLAVY